MLFANPDGSPCTMPCLFGVRPGEMTITQAIAILDTHPMTRHMRHQVLVNGYALDAQGIVLVIYSTDGVHINFLNLAPFSDNHSDEPPPPADSRLKAAMSGITPGNLY